MSTFDPSLRRASATLASDPIIDLLPILPTFVLDDMISALAESPCSSDFHLLATETETNAADSMAELRQRIEQEIAARSSV